MAYTIPKGLFDILPQTKEEWRTASRWQYLENILHAAAADYGFKEIRTPIFEKTELFVRSVGESSDIVSKEMYTFPDKKGRSMTLRPEGTAPVIRAYIEEQLHQISGESKFYYIGPMFRYDRPQAGRYRQFHQFGAEAIGVGTPEQDVEMIDFLCEIFRRLGLKNLTVHINSVGDAETREVYREKLAEFLEPHKGSLSEDSKARLEKNVLRILDSKDLDDQKLLEGAPSLLDFLSLEAKTHFERVQTLLKLLGIPFVVDPNLVRGLDYYTHTVFEVMSDKLGAQNTIGAGGRYDGLLATLGGPALPSCGFATGLERVLHTMESEGSSFPPPRNPDLFLIPMGEKALEACLNKGTYLRHQGWSVEIELSGKKIQYGLKRANELHAKFCAVVGERELASQQIEVKEMALHTASAVNWNDLETFLKMRRSL